MPEMLTEPFSGAAAWKSTDLSASDDWIYSLNSSEVNDVQQAVKHAARTNKDLNQLTDADFPLPVLDKRIAQLRTELELGRGFELWRGMPVDDWSDDERRIAFWGIGRHLGTSVVQNARGELLGSVLNTLGTDPTTNANSRFYHTNRAAPFHVDGADIVGLLCIRTARSGGSSLIVSSVSIYNALLRERPDLIPLLYQPLWFDHRGELNAVTGNPYWETAISGWANNKLSMMYLRPFLESAQRYPGAPALTDQHTELFDLIDRYAQSEELCLSMDFEPGDIQWLNNHMTMHSRTRYEDYPEPERRRWLLRLWLNLDERNRFTDTYGYYGIAPNRS